MFLQLNRRKANLALSKFQIVENNIGIGNSELFFNQVNIKNMVLQGRIGCDIVTLNLYRVFNEHFKENDVHKDGCGNYTLNNGRPEKIYYCGKKGTNIFNGIYYWSYKYGTSEFKAYEVGFGKNGIYLCVYKDDELISMISKEIYARNNQANYFIYANNSDFTSILVMICACWDIFRYISEKAGMYSHKLNTWQKELKNKFDPNFIPMIKVRDGIID